ncbi:AIR carboxylase family protein [Candidatus Micrarchaeota archaeon]|nr:AIR carboxylase family protein [Candidatus Micrarchaeota archaeon]
MNYQVVIVLGSRSDEGHGKRIEKKLAEFGVPSEMHVASAHKNTRKTLALVEKHDASANHVVYIAVAGRSNALGGVIEGNTLNPVINCPPYSEKYAGLDVLSSLRMPSNMGVVTILEPENAAYACVKMFALHDKELRAKLVSYKKKL